MSASIAREVRTLALPAIATSLLQTMVMVVDRIMLGHVSKTSLAAMQIAGPLEWSVFSIFLAFEVGTIARVGRLVGQREPARARSAAIVSLMLAVALGSVVALLSPVVLRLAPFAAHSASAEVIAASNDYLEITLLSSPVLFVAAAAIAVLQASGDTRTPLAIGVVANGVHIALNSVLVLGAFGFPPQGMRGCAWGTVVTFALEAALALWALSRAGRPVSLRRASGVAPLRPEAREVLRVGWPAMLERSLYHAGFLGYVGILGLLGDGPMAANQALISIEAICFLSADGFGVAAASLVAQKLGAGEPEQAARVAKISARDAVLVLTSLGLLSLLSRHLLVPLFAKDAAVIAIGLSAMPVLAIAQPFMATSIVLSQTLRGAGHTRTVLAVSTLGAFFVRLSATWFFAIRLGLGLPGIWLGSTCDWAVRSAILVPLAARTIRKPA